MRKSILILMTLGAMLLGALSISIGQVLTDTEGNVISIRRNEHFATFLTLATYEGTSWRECMFRTALCPNNCGHSGNMATFSVDKYIVYAKFHEYGDGKDGKFLVLIDNGENTKPLIDEKSYETIKSLKKGDRVLLSWNHLYVTETVGEFKSQFPERPINLILPITEKQAKFIPDVAAPKTEDGFEGMLRRYYVALASFSGRVEGVDLFQVDRHLHTYFYGDVATMEYLAVMAFNPNTTNQKIVDDIKNLKAGDFAIVAFRRDMVGNSSVDTPLFVLPETQQRAEALLKN